MANSFSNTKFRIPKGFQSLLVGLSIEVLRNQPRNIHAYAANYFERLLQQRDQGQSYLPDQQTNLEDQYYNNEYPVNGQEFNNAATKIQAQYRGHKTRKDLEKSKENKQNIDFNQEDDDKYQESSFDDEFTDEKERAAISIQAQFRGYQVRKGLQEKQQDIDQSPTSSRLHEHDEIDTGENNDINRPSFERESTDLSEDFERHTQIPRNSSFDREQQEKLFSEKDDMSDLNLDQAATRIQASYRGYKTRKELGSNSIGTNPNPGHDQYNNTRNKNILSPSAEGNKVPVGEGDDNAAAVKIQAAYRGYRVRKDLEK